MDFELFNTYSNKTELFIPLDDNDIRIYACGPTVYDYIHVGNARPLIIFDVLVRFLKLIYPKVTYVRNITDVDDKIIVQANQNKESINNLTERTIKAFSDDADALFVKKPDFEPRATEHIQEMLKMIKVLLENGNAYLSDGHVLFSVSSMPNYGKLSGMNLSEMIDGARVEVSDYKKEPADFVLWKPSKTEELGWHSDFGFGRPGWHIECSAMSEKYLGKQLDIQAGGLDLIFPHHENEIAQSRCANGNKSFSNYWVHNGFITISNEKMAKSQGNVFKIKDFHSKYNGQVLRLALVSTHYKQSLDWNDDLLKQSQKTLDKWYECYKEPNGKVLIDDKDLNPLYDDLNTPGYISNVHKLYDIAAKGSDKDKEIFTTACNFIGLLTEPKSKWLEFKKDNLNISEKEILQKIKDRNKARDNKNYELADKIRNELLDKGVLIEDKDDKTTWKLK